MRELVRDAQPGDSFFLYCTSLCSTYTDAILYIDSLLIEVSGHGVQIKDTDGDESDGLDECSLSCLLGMYVTDGISIQVSAPWITMATIHIRPATHLG
jgi:hypothetical protein